MKSVYGLLTLFLITYSFSTAGVCRDTLSAAVMQSPYAGGFTIPGKIEAEYFDLGGQGVSYYDADRENKGWAFRTSEAVDIENCTDAGGGYNIGYTVEGEWLEYTVNVTSSGLYTFELRTASTQFGSVIRLDLDGIAVSGNIVLPNTNGWQTWTTMKAKDISLPAGQHVLRLFVVAGGFNINFVNVVAPGATAGPGYLHASGRSIVNNSGNFQIKAINLGNYMVQEGYMLNLGGGFQYAIKNKIAEVVGPANRDKFYEDYLNAFITKADIDLIAQSGFNAVRLPMHYNLFTPLGQPDVSIEKGFILVDQVLNWCKANNLYLILDLHAAPGGQSNGDISDYIAGQPSLWESQANRDQTVKLWKVFAQRYANEEYIGGYDLINETNWTLPNNNALLVQLMKDITTAIRLVDNNHILFIEGNSYANDYNGLTPKWDANMAYSFHKYWNDNTDASLNFAFAVRDGQNVPIWMGEFGENSNTWLADAVTLMNKHNIGWAVWPYKKMGSISSVSSFKEPANWAALASFINGGVKPSATVGQAALNELVENVKVQNCTLNRGYLRALFDQPNNNETVANAVISIPGRVAAAKYDEGKQGYAYYDNTYQTTQFGAAGGEQTPWNAGWTGRNDGVDLEFSVIENTTIVGWTENNEWLQYTVNVTTSGWYSVKARVSGNGGTFSLSSNGVTLLNNVSVAAIGGWSSWQTQSLGNVSLSAGKNIIRLIFNKGGFNLNYLDFESAGTANKPPVVSIGSPSNNATFIAPGNVLLNATATDEDGTVAKVEFYNGTTLLGTSTSSPYYSYTWTAISVGTYAITAKATDNQGLSTITPVLTIIVKPPVPNQLPAVSLTSPSNNASYTAPANIYLTAMASDADGTVSGVEFYSGTTLLWTDVSAPYSYLWTNVAVGNYTLTAKAIDNLGASQWSAAVTSRVMGTVADACAGLPVYVEGNGYLEGSKVKSEGKRYECKPWPFSGWCNGADWAYAPGNGAYWSDAWTLLGSCAANGSREDAALTNVPALSASPTPFTHSSTIDVVVTTAGFISVKAYNKTGAWVATLAEGNFSAGTHRFTWQAERLETGIYLINYTHADGVVVTKTMKAE